MERREERVPLLKRSSEEEGGRGGGECLGLGQRVWIESSKLWRIVGPAIFTRVVAYSMNVITQAFAGHLGDLELASMSIAITVVVGFNFGLMLGMASALETLCGQAFGAKQYRMLGVYMQRSWIVLFLCATLLLPMYFFAAPILVFLGQPSDVAEQAGMVSMWFIPQHYSFVFLFPIQRFLQCQLKNSIIAMMSAIALVVHLSVSWLFMFQLKFGLVGTALTLDFSWWVAVFLLYGYVACGGCPQSWKGFSMEAFAGLWDFLKLSAASGVMLCLENWYYRILLLLTGNLMNAKIAVDALSVCMSINGLEMMIPLAFFAGTGVRVANELGAGNGKGARFATIISVVTSTIIGIFFCVMVMVLRDKVALIFTSSMAVLDAVDRLSALLALTILLNSVQPILSVVTSTIIGIFFCVMVMVLRDKVALIFTSSMAVLDAVDRLSALLALTILLNSVQPILSGVAVGSGWQATVAYVNIGTYYLIGIPVGILMGWIFHLGVLGIWGGMIGGTAVQTLILAFLTIRCDWDKEALVASTRIENSAVLK